MAQINTNREDFLSILFYALLLKLSYRNTVLPSDENTENTVKKISSKGILNDLYTHYLNLPSSIRNEAMRLKSSLLSNEQVIISIGSKKLTNDNLKKQVKQIVSHLEIPKNKKAVLLEMMCEVIDKKINEEIEND